MGHRSVGRALETSNIVPGVPGDHPATILEAGGRPARPSEQTIIFFRKLTPEQDQLQNPAHM